MNVDFEELVATRLRRVGQRLTPTRRRLLAVLARAGHPLTINEITSSELGWSREVWKQFAEVGLLGLGFDPDEAGQIEVMVVMTEIGRRLAPEPLAQAALTGAWLVRKNFAISTRSGS